MITGGLSLVTLIAVTLVVGGIVGARLAEANHRVNGLIAAHARDTSVDDDPALYPDEYIELDQLGLIRSTEPQCAHPPVIACTAECPRAQTQLNADGLTCSTLGHHWPDSLLLTDAANWIENACNEDPRGGEWTTSRALVAELRDRAAQFEALEATDLQ
ncbi:hypothetical protein SEA_IDENTITYCRISIS_38 [Mycobacterium phage IdentityCrisis]|uniref:Uncharacterized protein n=1 Tax=Mycobacterium phage IdentityCrisis TaxID=2599866 RepID=A0A5J6TJC3_9CAUD|nr:hypothetical protein QEH37_gp37 [Mycobacterium phage IdentityCrisis]QFG10057.1 hypothetical protein SEA_IDENTITYCRISIS_38 [Mycobacterium phage IdentityCrisis]